MKRTHEVKKVSDSFHTWLQDNHYLDKSIGHKIVENWKEIVGNTIYAHTERVNVSIPKIYLKIDNSSLKELLYMDKHLIIDKVNEFLKETLIQDIIFT